MKEGRREGGREVRERRVGGGCGGGENRKGGRGGRRERECD